MNSSIRRTFAIPTACSPVNELLTAIMRSFGENSAQSDRDQSSDTVSASQSCEDGNSGSNPQSAIRNPQF
jgi:hypothetical protein